MAARKKVLLIKIVVLGDSYVGKTCLLKQYTAHQFSNQHKPTIGTDFLTKDLLIDDHCVTMQIWDTAGQERFQSLGCSFYRGADCCILVYDVTSLSSFRALDIWRNEFLIYAAPHDPENFPFVVIGNKADLNDRQITTNKALNWCSEKSNIMHFETSAKNGGNIQKAFEAVARMALARDKRINEPSDILVPVQTREQDTSSNRCIC